MCSLVAGAPCLYRGPLSIGAPCLHGSHAWGHFLRVLDSRGPMHVGAPKNKMSIFYLSVAGNNYKL